jgi:NAD(P)H dehydrogenase (quinone)
VKVLVVFCHPIRDSFAGAVLDRCLAELARAGHAVTLRDLYAEGFDPVLSAAERQAYEDVPANAATIADHAADLRDAEGLLLVFPTWWYGMPAMLKGWFDRVWLPGVAFGLDPARGITPHGLPQIRRLMVATTFGAPRWFNRLWMGSPGKRVIFRGFKPLLGRGCRTAWAALYTMDGQTPQARARFLDHVAGKLRLFAD